MGTTRSDKDRRAAVLAVERPGQFDPSGADRRYWLLPQRRGSLCACPAGRDTDAPSRHPKGMRRACTVSRVGRVWLYQRRGNCDRRWLHRRGHGESAQPCARRLRRGPQLTRRKPAQRKVREMSRILTALAAMFLQQTFASVGKVLPAVVAPLVISERAQSCDFFWSGERAAEPIRGNADVPRRGRIAGPIPLWRENRPCANSLWFGTAHSRGRARRRCGSRVRDDPGRSSGSFAYHGRNRSRGFAPVVRCAPLMLAGGCYGPRNSGHQPGGWFSARLDQRAGARNDYAAPRCTEMKLRQFQAESLALVGADLARCRKSLQTRSDTEHHVTAARRFCTPVRRVAASTPTERALSVIHRLVSKNFTPTAPRYCEVIDRKRWHKSCRHPAVYWLVGRLAMFAKPRRWTAQRGGKLGLSLA